MIKQKKDRKSKKNIRPNKTVLWASLMGSDYYQPEHEPGSGPEGYYLVVSFRAKVVLFLIYFEITKNVSQFFLLLRLATFIR